MEVCWQRLPNTVVGKNNRIVPVTDLHIERSILYSGYAKHREETANIEYCADSADDIDLNRQNMYSRLAHS